MEACTIGDLLRVVANRHKVTGYDIYLAGHYGYVQLVTYFHLLGWNMDLVYKQACRYSYCDIIDYLIAAHVPMPHDILSYACESENIELIRNLLDAGASVNLDMEHPLFISVCKKEVNIIYLLYMYGCDMNSIDEDGWNGLHYACRVNNIQFVKVLLDLGTNKYHQNYQGHLPVNMTSNENIINLLS